MSDPNKLTVSVFENTFAPFLTIPNAPEKENTIQYPSTNVPMDVVVFAIRSGKYEAKIKEWHDGNLNKKLLPCFTPCGRFKLRLDSMLIQYSGLVVLDYDKVDSVVGLKYATRELPYTYCAFLSPSMKGVKVLVKHGYAPGQHKEAFEKISAYYDDYLGVKADRSGSNISRLCYFSADRDLHFNPGCETFKIEQNYTRPTEGDYTSEIDWLLDFTANKVGPYGEGNRSNFIYTLACNLNRYGYSQQLAGEICGAVWSEAKDAANEADFTRQVNNGYKNVAEHGKYKIPYKKIASK